MDLDVIVLIAASFGLGAAIQSSGLAGVIAAAMVAVSAAVGPVGILLGVGVVTMLLTELITNTAAAVLVFPVAVSTAAAAGLDPRPFAIGRRLRGVGLVPHPDRLSDQHDGLRTGRVPVHGLPASWRAAERGRAPRPGRARAALLEPVSPRDGLGAFRVKG